MPGVWRARSLACKGKTRELVTAGSPKTFRHSPRDGFTVYGALSLVSRACCHHHQRNARALSPT
jgi:hypothetical protein